MGEAQPKESAPDRSVIVSGLSVTRPERNSDAVSYAEVANHKKPYSPVTIATTIHHLMFVNVATSEQAMERATTIGKTTNMK